MEKRDKCCTQFLNWFKSFKLQNFEHCKHYYTVFQYFHYPDVLKCTFSTRKCFWFILCFTTQANWEQFIVYNADLEPTCGFPWYDFQTGEILHMYSKSLDIDGDYVPQHPWNQCERNTTRVGYFCISTLISVANGFLQVPHNNCNQ